MYTDVTPGSSPNFIIIAISVAGNPAAAKSDYEQALRLVEDFQAAQEALERVNAALAKVQ